MTTSAVIHIPHIEVTTCAKLDASKPNWDPKSKVAGGQIKSIWESPQWKNRNER